MALGWPKIKRFLSELDRRMREIPNLDEWEPTEEHQNIIRKTLEEMFCELGQHDYTFLKIVSGGAVLQCKRCEHTVICSLTKTIH